MAITAAQLKAVLGADVAPAVSGLRLFSGLLRGTRDQAQQDTRQISSFFGDMIKVDLLKAGLNAVKGVFSDLATVGREALTAVSGYENLNQSMRQLTATSLVQAGVTDEMREALRLAEEPAAGLVTWIERLARVSPFDTEGVAKMVQLGLAFNFSTAESKRLTSALVDFSSATGRGTEVGDRLMLSLGQMAAKGKITGEELREMASAGLPALQILAKGFGVSTTQMQKMVESGTVPAGKALQAITEYLERNFAGAAERTANTWQGLMSSLGDIKKQDLRALFGGVFEAIRPEFASLVDYLGSSEFQGRLKAIGEDLGNALKTGIALFKDEFRALDTAGLFDGLKQGLKALGSGQEIVDLQSGVRGVVLFIGDAIVAAKTFGETFAAYTASDTDAIVDFVQVGIAQLKLLWDAGERILTLFSALGRVIGTFSVLTTPQAMTSNPLGFAQALKDLGSLQGEINLIKASWNGLGNASAQFEQNVSAYATRNDERLSALNERLAGINTQHDKEKAALAEVARAYDAVIIREANRERLVASEDSDAERLRGSDRKVVTDIKDGLATSKALQRDTWSQLGSAAGESFGKRAKTLLEEAFDLIRNPIKSAIDDAKKLIPGYKEPGAPGTNGWAEDIFRIIDVAQNLGTPHEGQDTRKWYTKYYGTMGFPEAVNLAKGTQDAFLRGDLMAPNVRPYLDDNKLRADLQRNAAAGGSLDEYARMIGSDKKTLTALLQQGGKASDAEIAALTGGGAPAKSASTVAGAGGAAGKDTSLLSNLVGGGDEVKFDQVAPNLLAGIDKMLADNADNIKQRGQAFWQKFEEGLITAASSSGALWRAVDALVVQSLEKHLVGA